ncbi:hypothetical protein FRC96_12920 [Lujinxingia vulgaris]|uniref:Uncharacterized protein n=1 Tax=Lujinxingia vulgaris TaxID=2600176 RepID=A0A5C6X4K1_9DELT|nr:hypothetical protein [Lujinxingia vulgaris]TXD34520.1 hypothetical protein FRC96_12920 [Lujinxingia vulgaris]
MRQLPRNLAIAAALALTALACSDDVLSDDTRDVSPDADPVFEFAEPAPCPTQSPWVYGGCYGVMGVVFDGTQCVTASGCGCPNDDCPAFETLEACAAACDQPTE